MLTNKVYKICLDEVVAAGSERVELGGIYILLNDVPAAKLVKVSWPPLVIVRVSAASDDLI